MKLKKILDLLFLFDVKNCLIFQNTFLICKHFKPRQTEEHGMRLIIELLLSLAKNFKIEALSKMCDTLYLLTIKLQTFQIKEI